MQINRPNKNEELLNIPKYPQQHYDINSPNAMKSVQYK